MTYLCMSADELAAWLEAARRVRNGGRTPCTDCPMAYHLAMKAIGRCDRKPINGHAGRVAVHRERRSYNRYATREEAHQARLRYNREWKRQKRAAA